MKKGPSLQEGRYFFSCAVFQDPDSLFNKIVVAGGYNQSRVDTNSVEILDPFPDPTISNKWEYGKYGSIGCGVSSSKFWKAIN